MNENLGILNEIALQVQKLVNAETAVVALAEDNGETVYYAAAVGKHGEYILNKRSAAATSGLCGTAFQEGEAVLVCRTEGDNRVRQDHAKALGIETALAVPLYDQGELLGALLAFNRNDGNLFDRVTEQALAEYAPVAASLIFQQR